MGKISRGAVIRVLLCISILIALAQMGLSYADVGITGMASGGVAAVDISAVPQSVADDAGKLAQELFGSGAKYRDFYNQLVAAYAEARDKDFILLFNSGGWGGTSVKDAPGWDTIIDGITSELAGEGYHAVVLDYRRTTGSWLGRWKELMEVFNHYPSKARGLAERVDFLTDHIPNVRVIVTGESNGTVVSDYAMALMRDNDRVFSIQTGIPFWHHQMVYERTLMLKDNGVTPDALSRGEVPAVVWATVKQWLQLSPPDTAHTGHYLDAPGHDYSWHYTEVVTEITRFLQENFFQQ